MLSLSSLSPVSMFGISATQVQNLALGVVNLYKAGMDPPLKSVQVPLNDIPSFWCVDCTTLLGAICNLAVQIKMFIPAVLGGEVYIFICFMRIEGTKMRMEEKETGYNPCNRKAINLDLRYLFDSYSYIIVISSPYTILPCYKEKQDDLGKKVGKIHFL